MSRSGYSEEGDYLFLYRATVERAIQGKRGQTFLRELAKALDEMPEKRLIANKLISKNGEMCTIGVVCNARNIDVSDVDVEDSERVGQLVNIAQAMAAEIEYENDENGPHNETAEQRWTRMRGWVTENLKDSK